MKPKTAQPEVLLSVADVERNLHITGPPPGMSIPTAGEAFKTGPPPGIGNIPTPDAAFGLAKPKIPSAAEAFNLPSATSAPHPLSGYSRSPRPHTSWVQMASAGHSAVAPSPPPTQMGGHNGSGPPSSMPPPTNMLPPPGVMPMPRPPMLVPPQSTTVPPPPVPAHPILAMGPGGPLWVAPNGEPLGPRPMYPQPSQHTTALPPPPPQLSKESSSNDDHTHGERRGPPVDDPNRGSSGPRTSQASARPPRKQGIMMRASDIKFVVNKVMAPLEIVDPFSDDFYFLQMALKKNNQQRQHAAEVGGAFVPPLVIPLPAWKTTRERVQAQLEETKSKQQTRSRQWEEKEKVLGHLERSDPTKPRSALSVPSPSFDEEDDLDDDDDETLESGGFRIPFATRLWGMRLAVQRGHEALYTVQVSQQLVSFRSLNFIDPSVFIPPYVLITGVASPSKSADDYGPTSRKE